MGNTENKKKDENIAEVYGLYSEYMFKMRCLPKEYLDRYGFGVESDFDGIYGIERILYNGEVVLEAYASFPTKYHPGEWVQVMENAIAEIEKEPDNPIKRTLDRRN